MAVTSVNHVRCELMIVLLINGALSAIIESPMNTLVVQCVDDNATMNCKSDQQNEITWTYDGNSVVSGACQPAFDDGIFTGNPSDNGRSCQLVASLSQASSDSLLVTVSGPYGCTDRESSGVTAQSMVVVLDMWCGVVDNCAVKESNDVTVGCYVQYDWLSYLLQYNPITRINSSLRFLEDPESFRGLQVAEIPFLVTSGPPSVFLNTTYTIRNVQPGQTVTATCRVDHLFNPITGYSGRKTYAINSLSYSCTVQRPVHYCPRNVRIVRGNEELTCYADSYPPASYLWIDHGRNTVTTGQKLILQPERNDTFTCIAYSNVSCEEGNICRRRGSLASKYSNDTNFPFTLFGYEAFSESCQASKSIGPTDATSGAPPCDVSSTPDYYMYSTIALGAFSLLAIIVIVALTVYIISLKKRKPEEDDKDAYYSSTNMAGRQLPPEPYEELHMDDARRREQVDDAGRDNYIELVM